MWTVDVKVYEGKRRGHLAQNGIVPAIMQFRAKKVRDKFLVFGQPILGQAEIDEVVNSLHSGWIGTGPKVRRFEKALEEYIGAPHVRCLSSGTAALMLALRVLGVGPGDEVILPSMTFVASANAIEHSGATPVFVDCEPVSGLIDLNAAEAAITEQTKAIMPVHLYGRPVDMDRVTAIRDKYGIAVVEDAAHALGAEWRGKRIGTHGNLTAYSFYVTKNITTAEGGALVTEDPEIAERVERLALHGLSAGAWQRFSDIGYKHYEVIEPGFKFNMIDLLAAIGLHQLPQLDEWINLRAGIWRRYNELLREMPLEGPEVGPSEDLRHCRHLYPILINVDEGVTRDAVLDRLNAANIGSGVHYRAVHLHPYYASRYGLRPDSMPVALEMSERTLSLPLKADMTLEDQADVVDALSAALDCV